MDLLAAARKDLPAGNLELGGLLARIGLVHLQMEKYAESEPLLRECLAIREKAQADSWLTFNTYSLLGNALLGQKKYAEAEPLLIKGYEGMEQRFTSIPVAARIRLTESIERLVKLYEEKNNSEEAAKWQARLDQRRERNDSAQ